MRKEKNMAAKKTVEDTNIETPSAETEEAKTVKKTTTATKKPAAPARRLSFRPVTASEIEARVQGKGKYKTTVLLYKDARVDQNILDETVGCYDWKKEYSRDNQNCTVSLWDAEKQQWISKEDTGTESNTEKEKGLASDSFKRACFCWGIGRELYTTPLIQIPNEFIDWDERNGRDVTYDRFLVKSLEVSVDEDTGYKHITKIIIAIQHNGKVDWVWAWQENGNVQLHKPSWLSDSGSTDNSFNGSADSSNSSEGGVVKSGGWGKSNSVSTSSTASTGKGFKKPASEGSTRTFGSTFKKSS